MRWIRVSPAIVLSLAALFFSLGGSAFGFATRETKATPAQPKCAQGAVRGILEVTGQTGHGVANLPDQFTADANYFGRDFNCKGTAAQARRLSTGLYFVRFPGNPANSAIVSAMSGDASSAAIQRQPDGSFQVTVGSRNTPEDVPFIVVLL